MSFLYFSHVIFKNNQTIVSWGVFLIPFIIYSFYSPSTITFWDSPEFVSSNYLLQTTHPAGAPFYTIVANFLMGILFFLEPVVVSNIISALFGALTVKIVFDCIVIIVTNLVKKDDDKLIPLISGILGASSLAFSHSFWTASTETEVYSLSFFLLTFIFKLGLLWEKATSYNKERKILLLIILLLGISVGVHLINIAIVIPLSIVFINKKKGNKLQHIVTAVITGLFIFFFLLNIVFQGTIALLAKIDVWLVNDFSFPVNFGALLGLFFILLGISFLIFISHKLKKDLLNTISIAILLFYIGISSYLFPIIRSQNITPISNTTATPTELLRYIKAEQFGVAGIPLLKGSSFNAVLDTKRPFFNGNPKLIYDSELNKYRVYDSGKNSIKNYDKRFDLFFPRLFHKSALNQEAYKTWTTIKGTPIALQGENKTVFKPTFSENLAYFYNYQLNWLYFRYLFQNFIGTQNTLKGTGNITKGNWVTGFNFIDKYRVGDKEFTPYFYKNLDSNDAFFALPFLLGILGLLYLRRHKTYLLTTLLLFITFGIGIIIYVNPVPQSILIRERDYIFTGSFIFFSIWIGLSLPYLYTVLKIIKNKKIKLLVVSSTLLLISPIQLIVKGFDNHNRTHENFAYELGKAYLDACPNQAILITNIDNSTFPIWYLQEVENYRTDVRVINYDQLLLGWYIEKLKFKLNDSKPIHLTLNSDFIHSKFDTEIPFNKITNGFLNLKELGSFLNNPKNKLSVKNIDFSFFPTENLILPISKNIPEFNEQVEKMDAVKWVFKKNIYLKNDLVLLDIIGNNFNNRPICFAETGTKSHLVNLDHLLIQKGLVYQLLPFKRKEKTSNPKIIDTETSYKNLVLTNTFTKKNNNASKVTDEVLSLSRSIIRRNHYFLAQALIENKDFAKAEKVIDYSFETFPNATIPFQEYGFALGKLYYRLNKIDKGNDICLTSIANMEGELKWLLSFDPPNPIINVRYANRLFEVYSQMILQIQPYNTNLFTKLSKNKEILEKQLITWRKKNWPY